ncbi:MAG TPA: AraC family transcriptional regulator [Gemmatimonadaceae bacterium]|jgi:AraC-like DNA-binding protein|nr:AraC family transcriptional regulator [Gemmatimonadaceae bacterium]
MRDLTVGAMVFRALLELAVSRGASRKALAERSGIDLADLRDADNRVPFSKYVALMRAGQELCNDPALALHFGEAIDPSEVSIAHAFGATGDMADAIAEGNRYAPLAVEVEGDGTGDRLQVRRERGQLWLVDARRNPNDFPELTESTFARMVCTARRHFGDSQVFREVHVTHAEPRYRAEYERIFRVPVVFGSSRNALWLNEALVARFQSPPSSQYLSSVLRSHADGLLRKLERSQTTRDRVETALMPLLPAGAASMHVIAGTLCVSRQTLFRQLKAERTTFEEVLDELRRKLAVNYLGTAGASVKETARRLGYADATAFSRAFKRWTGLSPRDYVPRSASSADRQTQIK